MRMIVIFMQIFFIVFETKTFFSTILCLSILIQALQLPIFMEHASKWRKLLIEYDGNELLTERHLIFWQNQKSSEKSNHSLTWDFFIVLPLSERKLRYGADFNLESSVTIRNMFSVS